MTPQQIAENERAFLDSNFSPLDISGCPSLQPLPKEENQLEDKDGFNRVDTFGPGPGDLKRNLAQIANEPEVLEEIAKDNPAAADALAEAKDIAAGNESRKFMEANQDYEKHDDNMFALVSVLAHNCLGVTEREIESAGLKELKAMQHDLIERGYWTQGWLETAWDALRRHGLAELRPGLVRELSADEKLTVIRQAQRGVNLGDPNAVLEAVGLYCSYALDLDDLDDLDLDDPAYRPVVDAAVFFCWEQTEPAYSPTPERRAWLLDYFKNRPLSFPLVAQAFKALQQAEARGYTNQLLAPKEISTSGSLDDLSDEQVNSLYANTRKYVARTPGVLQ